MASAFKKFIAGLPGGILGSKSLLETLKDINTLLKPNPDLPESQKTKLRARLIALAIASLTSDHQIALISSVLGLTALIARAAEEAGNSNEQEPASSVAELMTCRSLGVVFGPLLFGNRTQEINLTPEHSRGSLLAVPRSPQKRRKDRRRKTDCPKKLDNGGLALNVERAKLTAGIMEMLVSDWEDVVRQFRNIGVTELQHTMPGPKTHAIAGNSELGVQSEDEPMQNQLPGDIEGSLVIKKSRSKGQPFVDSLVTTWHLDNESGGRNMPAQIATNLEKNSEIISPSQITLIGDRGINDQSTLLWTLDEPETADRSQAHPTTNSSHEIYCEAETWPRDLSVADARKETTDPDIKAERPKFDSQEHEFGTEQKRKKDLIDMSSAIQPTPPLNERWYPSMLRESFEQLGLQGLEQSKSCEGDPGAIPDANVLIENSASSNGACGDTLASSEDGKAKLTQNQIKNAPLLADNPSTPPPEPGCGLEHTPPIAQGLVTPRIGRNSIRAFSDLPNKSIPIRQSSLSRSPQKHVVTPTKQIEIIQRSTSLSSISPSTNMPRFNVLPRSLTVSSADKLSKTLPINEEPPIAQHIQFRYSAERLRSRSDTSSQQDLSLASSSKGNATLYAEIRRLQRQVELRTEEAHQAHRQLEAMRNYRDSGTLSEKLREVQRGLKTWKNRAEWAEKRLLMQDCERRRSFAAADISEHALIEESEKESRRATMI